MTGVKKRRKVSKGVVFMLNRGNKMLNKGLNRPENDKKSEN